MIRKQLIKNKKVLSTIPIILLFLIIGSSFNNEGSVRIVEATSSSYYLTQTTFSNHRNIKPAKIDDQRYLVYSDGAGSTQDYITVYEATSSWGFDTNYWTNTNATGEFYLKTFDNEPDTIWIFGTYNGVYGFITYFLTNSSSFGTVKSISEDYITDIIWVDPYFYITVVNVPVSNYIYRSSKANLFTPSSWTSISYPAWLGGSYEEPRIAYFNGFIYILRTNTDYFYNLLKWDLGSTFTTLLSNTDSSTETYFIFPFVRSSLDFIMVCLPERLPSKQIHIKYSTDGTTFTEILAVDFVSLADNSELQCSAIPLNTTDYWLSLTRDTAGTEGYNKVYNIDGDLLGSCLNVVTHPSNAYLVSDGVNKWVAGGEGLLINPDATLKTVVYGNPYKTDTTCIHLVTISVNDVYHDYNNSGESITCSVGQILQGFLIDVYLDKSYASSKEQCANITRVNLLLLDPYSNVVYNGTVYTTDLNVITDMGTYWKETFVIGIWETLSVGTYTWTVRYEIHI